MVPNGLLKIIKMLYGRCNCKQRCHISTGFHSSIYPIKYQKENICILLDQGYETFCPRLKEHFGRPLRLRKCLYGADFSGKIWYETLNHFLFDSFGFKHSRVEWCLYIYRNRMTGLKCT